MKHSVQSVRAKPVLQMDSIRDNETTSRLTAAATALVVDSRLTETLPIVALLTAEGFEVTVAESFHRAKDRLTARPPNLLITEIRLGEYNGLHLVLRGKAVGRRMAALVMSSVADPVLQSEAEAMGATFLVKPIDDRQFLAAVARTLFPTGSVGRPRPDAIRAPPLGSACVERDRPSGSTGRTKGAASSPSACNRTRQPDPHDAPRLRSPAGLTSASPAHEPAF